MKKPREEYIKPSVIELEYEVDMTVRMGNCKTTTAQNSGEGQCGSQRQVDGPCSTIGS